MNEDASKDITERENVHKKELENRRKVTELVEAFPGSKVELKVSRLNAEVLDDIMEGKSPKLRS